MNWYRVRLKLHSPTGTPWQADTIFGHLCWALRLHKGEAELRDFLEFYREGEPVFLLSDGFPGGVLPRPLFQTVPTGESLEAFREGREARKQVFLSHDEFLRALRGESFLPRSRDDQVGSLVRVATKNQINRHTGTTGQEGQLFGFIEYWNTEVTIYLKVDDGCESLVRELFGWLAEAGYGKRRSVGYGAIDSCTVEPFEGFPIPEGSNAFVSLSPFVPAERDPVRGRWRIRVKYGRLGEEFAIGENPFKRPLIMLTAGSAFFDMPVRAHYGRMVPGVSPARPEVVQYGYALPVPMRLPDFGEDDRA